MIGTDMNGGSQAAIHPIFWQRFDKLCQFATAFQRLSEMRMQAARRQGWPASKRWFVIQKPCLCCNSSG